MCLSHYNYFLSPLQCKHYPSTKTRPYARCLETSFKTVLINCNNANNLSYDDRFLSALLLTGNRHMITYQIILSIRGHFYVAVRITLGIISRNSVVTLHEAQFEAKVRLMAWPIMRSKLRVRLILRVSLKIRPH